MKSIRGYFFNYFFLTIVVVFGVLSFFLYRSSTGYLENSLIIDNSLILENVSKNISSHYRGRLTSLQYLANDISVEDLNSAKGKIKSYLKYETLIGSVHVYDHQGKLLIAEKKNSLPPYSIGRTIYENDINFAPYAVRAMKEDRNLLTPIFLSKKTKFYQTFMVPLRNRTNQVTGLVSGAIFPFLTDLKYTVEGLSLGAENTFVIAADGGHIVAHTAGQTELPENISSFAKRVLSTGQNSLRNEGVSRIDQGQSDFPYIVLNKSNPETQTHFMFFVSKSKLLMKKEEMLHSSIIAYLISLLTGLVAATLISHRLSRPLNQLFQALHKINRGDFTARTNIKGNDVLSKICEECDVLSMNIEKDRYIATLWSGKLGDHEKPSSK